MTEFFLCLNDGRVFKTTAIDKPAAFNRAFSENYNPDDDIMSDQPTFMDCVTHIEWQAVDIVTDEAVYYLQHYSNGTITKSPHSTLIPYYNAQFEVGIEPEIYECEEEI